jgi:dipeptidyl aminopeptidase/acylaminoacyl peptidase
MQHYFMTTMHRFIAVGLLLLYFHLVPQAQNDSLRAFEPELFVELPNVRDMAISPDGKEMFFTVESYKKEFSAVFTCLKKGKKWSKPQLAPFSGEFRDLEPAFSPDGLRLFFVSARPLSQSSKEAKDYDIWYLERKSAAEAWSAPIHAGPIVNTKKDEFYPSVATNGNIYFTRETPDATPHEDIWVCEWKENQWQAAQQLGNGVNTQGAEYNAFVAPDESYLIFGAYKRIGDQGGGDLWASQRGANDEWLPAKPMPLPINSPRIDFCPFVEAATGLLYFTTERSAIPKQMPRKMATAELLSLMKTPANGLERVFCIAFKLP